MPKTYTEMVADLKATKAAKAEEMKKTANASMERGESMTPAEQQQFDALEAEIKTLDGDIERFEKLAALDIEKAEPVKAAAVPGQQAKLPVQVKQTENVDGGILLARYAFANAAALKGINGLRDPIEIAKRLWPNDEKIQSVLKTDVSAASTGNSGWAGAMVLPGGGFFQDFVKLVQDRSLIGQVWNRFRLIARDTEILVQATQMPSGKTATREGYAKPVLAETFSSTKHQIAKFAGITVITDEMLRRASTDVMTIIRDELADTLARDIDVQFLSDNAAAVSGTASVGIFNGVSPTALSGGVDVDSISCDIAEFLVAYNALNKTLMGAFWVMSENTAIRLSMAKTALGAPAFPTITATGGTLAGLPVYTSGYMIDDSNGPRVALINGNDMYKLDEGGLQLSTNDQGSIEMNDAPGGEAITPTAATGKVVHLWQQNLVAVRAERFLGWAKRRSGAVLWANVNWDACAGS